MKGNFNKLARAAGRSINLVNRKDLNPTVAPIVSIVNTEAKAFLDADETVRQAFARLKEEEAATQKWMETLAKGYDVARATILTHVPTEELGEAASLATTPDDLVRLAVAARSAAEKHSAEEWATKLLETFGPQVGAAEEAVEKLTAQGAETQKLQAARREAGERFWDVLVGFRKVIRAVYGRKSREYRSLIGRNLEENEAEDDPLTPAAPVDGQEPKKQAA